MLRYILFSSIALLAISIIPSYSTGSSVELTVDYKQAAPQDLHCSLAAKDETVKWFKDGEPVVDKEKEYLIIPENQTLRLLKIDPKLIGIFVCKYNTSMELPFLVKVRPYVTPFDKTRNVIQGDPLRLDCKAWGIPDVKVAWFHGETPLIPDDSGKITLKSSGGGSGDSFPEVQNATIRIVEMDYAEAGNYSCRVTNTINGVDITVNATVLVQVKDKYAALWPFLGICVEVAVLCTIILIYERRRAKRIEEEERQEEAAHLNANNETRPGAGNDEVRQRK